MKKCTKCGKKKPLDEFYTGPRYSDGHRNECKSCMKGCVAERQRRTAVARRAKWAEIARQNAAEADHA